MNDPPATAERALRRLAAYQFAITVLAEGDTLDQILPRLLAGVGEALGWHLGAAWQVDAESARLRCTHVWSLPEARAAADPACLQGTLVGPGDGIIGNVWSSGTGAWIHELRGLLSDQSDFAVSGALQAGVAVPIRSHGEVLAIIAFFSLTDRFSDDELLGDLTRIALQVAQFEQRRRAEHRLRRLNEQLEARIAQRTSELQRSEERWRYLLANHPDYICWLDLEGRILFLNRTAGGYTLDQVIGRHAWEYVAPESCQEVRSCIEQVIRSGEPGAYEAEHLLPEGERRWYRSRVAPVHEHGVLSSLLLISADVTERRHTEEALRQSNLRNRLVAQAANDAIWDWDPVTGLSQWSEGARSVLCFPDGGVSSALDWWLGNVHPEDRERVRESLDAALQSDATIWSAEYRFRRRDGGYATVVDRGIIVRNSGGQALRMVGAMLDITGRRQTEEALARSLSVLEATLESTLEGILVVDNDGRIVTFNRRFLELWNLPEHAASPGDDERVLAPVLEQIRDRATFLDRIRDLKSDPQQESLDLLELVDGRTFERYSKPRREAGRIAGRVWSFRDITERRKTDEKLRRSEKQYRDLVEASEDLIWSANRDGTITFVNRAVQRMYGYEPEEVIGRHFRMVVPPERVESALQVFADIIQGSARRQEEAEHLRKDGSRMYVSLNALPVRDDAGHVTGATGTITDISVRKRFEEALERSARDEREFKEALAEILAISNQLAVMPSTDELCRRAVELGRERLGFDRLAIWFLNDDDTVTGCFGTDEHGCTRDERMHTLVLGGAGSRPSLMTRQLTSGVRTEERDLYNDRAERVGRGMHMVAPMNDGHTVIGFVCADNLLTGRPLTEQRMEILTMYAATLGHLCSRKRAEESLQESEHKYKNLVETTNTGYLITDPSGRVIDANPEYVRMCGAATLAELIGRHVTDAVAPADRERAGARLAECLAQGQVGSLELEYLRPDQTTIHVEMNATTIRTPEGPRVLSLCRDITERVRLQRQVLRSQKLESIGTLAGGIAHDFNNLLAVILGNASVHYRDRGLPPRLRESLGDIITAAERGSSLTQQLLVYARGGLQRPAPVQLNALIAPLIHMLRRTAPPQIEFVLNLDQQLPPIMADPSQLEQVVMNLCLNAIQASAAPSHIEVRTSTEDLDGARAAELELLQGRYVCLQVKDQGCGMDPETVARIFEPFFTTRNMGRGMGLSASQGIVQNHGGQIRAESAPGRGTVMSVWLPIAPANRTKPPPPGVPRRLTPHGTETVFVIDDEPGVTRTIEQILTSLGYCVVAQNGSEGALRFLQNNAEDVDIILLDLNMPRCSGADMFHQLRGHCPSAPIVLTSGFDDAETVKALLAQGAAEFLQKPFSIGALASTVRRVLDESAGRRTGSPG